MAHRVLQQWIALHGFIAQQSRTLAQLRAVIRLDPNTPPTPPTLDEAVFDQLLEGWALILNPRVAAALVDASTSLLHAPDYRPRVSPSFEADPNQRLHPQPQGLPVTLVDGLEAQLIALAGAFEDARLDASIDRVVRDRARRLLRRAWPIFAMAQGIYDRAEVHAGALAWAGDWRAARDQFAPAVAGFLKSAEAALIVENPLGIEAEDLPLYRVGDQSGAFDKFTAMSTGLLSDRDSVNAPQRIADAIARLNLIQSDWTDRLSQNWLNDQQFWREETSIAEIHRHYGEIITGICGQSSWDSLTILDEIKAMDCNYDGNIISGNCEFSAEKCFINQDLSDCEFDDSDAKLRISKANIGYEMCFFNYLRKRFGEEVSTGDSNIDDYVISLFYQSDSMDEDRLFVIDDYLIEHWPNEIDYIDRYNSFDQADADSVAEAMSICENFRQRFNDERPNDVPHGCSLNEHCPVGYFCTSNLADGICQVENSDLNENPECFLGSMGQAAIDILVSSRDVDISRSQLTEYMDRYDNSMRSCFISQMGGDLLENALQRHNNNMNEMGGWKLAADITANMAAAAKDAASADTIFTGGAKGAAAVAEGVAKSVSDGLQYGMDRADRQHAEDMLALENDIQDQTCFNDAEMELVGMRTATLDIQRSMLALSGQLAELRNQRIAVGAAVGEGLRALNNAEARRVSPLMVDNWLPERLDPFHAAMRRARRAVYLTIRAVEYEFQQTQGALRMQTINARSPYELEAIMGELQAEARPGSILGENPNEALTVISFKNDLLQLADNPSPSEGWQPHTQTYRLRSKLRATQFKVYDKDGVYLGQEIPFSIYPLEAAGLGNGMTTTLFSENHCAERLWSINASILGSHLWAGRETTKAEITISKRNTFLSQWCSEAPEDEPYQVASIRPSRNLFIDPYSEGRDIEQNGDEAQGFTDAQIGAYFNVSIADLEAEAYEQGDSEQLAGRGLYGAYTLFIPVGQISVNGSDGLRLHRVDDILLRLDYVSVARGRD
ncbi:hypothetical protein KKF91_21570 [Myxococcota bacterium]|nr:hypothetical protein [Myxococcota bacterium]MBU1898531.1 hypothetical protein [Myxococcota bacterium]